MCPYHENVIYVSSPNEWPYTLCLQESILQVTLDTRIVMEYTFTVAAALMVCATIGLTSISNPEVPSACSPLGEYVLSLAKASSCSKVHNTIVH